MHTAPAHHHYREAPDRLDTRQLDEYTRLGYLAFENVLDAEEVEAARGALSDVIRRTHAAAIGRFAEVQLETADKDTQANYAGIGIRKTGGEFHLRFQEGVDPMALGAEKAEMSVRVLYSYRDEHPVFQRLVAHPRIMAVVESIVGAGALLFQDMALIKPPFIGSEKPWHQDDAYFSYAPLTHIVGVWIALDDARASNGCMHVIPGGHAAGGIRHFHSAVDCEIVPGRIRQQEAVPIELPPGGALFFSGLLPHQTPANRSSLRRRALQFHYRGADTRKLEKVEYDKVYVEPDGTPASCKAARAAQA